MAHHIDHYNEVNELPTEDLRRVVTAVVTAVAARLDIEPDVLFEEVEAVLDAQIIRDPDTPTPPIEDISPRL
jgi:hypothetical protein